MIHAIVFEITNVLFRERISDVINQLKDDGLDDEQLHHLFYSDSAQRFRRGVLPSEMYWSYIKENMPDADIKTIKNVMYGSYIPHDGMFDLVLGLKKMGYCLAVMSRNMRECTNYLDQRYHFRCFFDVEVYSAETAVEDVNEIYHRLFFFLRIPPERCVYISEERDFLKAAKSLGMHTVIFKNPEKLKSELKKKGIKLR